MGFTDSIAVDKFKKRGAKTAVIPLDLTCADHQALVEQWLESGQVAWVHLAPPCGTASLARTIPVPGSTFVPQPLRSRDEPEGFANLSGSDKVRVDAANCLYMWCCSIFFLCTLKGIICTLENPRGSLLWCTKWWLEVQRAIQLYAGDFQACMLGSSRPKWTRIVANTHHIERLNLECSGDHEHAPWGKTFDPDTGKLVWATSLEASYPRPMCVALVQCVLEGLMGAGIRMPPKVISDISSDPHLVSQSLQTIVEKQPRGAHMPPIVPEFSGIQEILVAPTTESPCELLHKLPATFTYGDIAVPKAAKLLRRSQQGSTQGRGESSGSDGNHKMVFGLPWTVEDFTKAAVLAAHPKDLLLGLPLELAEVAKYLAHTKDHVIVQERSRWLRQWVSLAPKLNDEESALKVQMAPHVKAITTGKKILLLERMLESIGFEDVESIDILKRGAPLVGNIGNIPGFAKKFRPALLTVKQLESSAVARNTATLARAKSSGDEDLDTKVWEETQLELQRGWIDGPFGLSDLEQGAVVSHRFGLLQRNRTKLRLIDDFSVSGVNATVQTDAKPDLQAINCLAALTVAWFKRCKECGRSSDLLSKTYDLSAAYRQIPVRAEHLKFAYVSVYCPSTGKPVIYRLLSMPFGATHSVFAFLRLSKQIYSLAVRGLGIPLTNFYDDFILCSTPPLAANTASCMELLLDLTGWIYAKTGSKATEFGPLCQALGVQIDLIGSPGRVLKLGNTESRVKELLSQIDSILAAGHLTHGEALQLRGRLGFTESFVTGRCGSWVLRLLIEHAYHGKGTQVPDSIRMALLFMKSRLVNCPPRSVSDRDRPRFTIFCDAAYEGGLGGIGAVLLDESGNCISWFGGQVDKTVCDRISRNGHKKTIIFELEMLAVCLAFDSWKDKVRGSNLVIFTDNEGVKHCLVRGNCQDNFAFQILHSFLEMEFSNDAELWIARVPSEANIADYPSRLADHPFLTCDCLFTLDVNEAIKAVLDRCSVSQGHEGATVPQSKKYASAPTSVSTAPSHQAKEEDDKLQRSGNVSFLV